jgi:hypothetical protein
VAGSLSGFRGSRVTSGSIVSRIVTPTAATAVTTSAIAVVINLATEWKTNLLAWLAVGVLTILSSLISLWFYRRQDEGIKERDSVPLAGHNEAYLGANSRLARATLEGKSNSWRSGRRLRAETLEMIAGSSGQSSTMPPNPPDVDQQHPVADTSRKLS